MEDKMSEPISSTAAGAAGWKLIGGAAGAMGIGSALATVVVMLMTRPRSSKEWAVGLISTVIGSFGGGAYAIIKLELLRSASSMNDAELFALVMTMIGIVFSCGLPAWALVRWVFTFIEKRQGKDIAEVVNEVKGMV
jgi:hypothetical protein